MLEVKPRSGFPRVPSMVDSPGPHLSRVSRRDTQSKLLPRPPFKASLAENSSQQLYSDISLVRILKTVLPRETGNC